MNLLENIQKLSAIRGVSGCEDLVREEIIRQLPGNCDYKIDALGNLIVYKKGRQTPKNKILFSAHMDEVGFIVTFIESSGLLRFAPVGGIDSRVVVGKPVEVGDNALPGIIGTKAVHMQTESEREKPLDLDKLYIDIGANSKEQAEEYVSPGDRVCFLNSFATLGEHKIMGKAFDDRAGCAIMLDMLHTELPYDCAFSFTVQEETGCTGAVTAAYEVNPDIAIAIETTTASDIAGTDDDQKVCLLGEGPVISFKDSGTVYDYQLFNLAMEIGHKQNIKCQRKLGTSGGNESRSLQKAKNGARVMAVSMPCRYLHSASCVLDTRDISSTAQLLQALLQELANL